MVGAAPSGVGGAAEALLGPPVADEAGQGAAGIVGIGQPPPYLRRWRFPPLFVLVALLVGVEAVDVPGIEGVPPLVGREFPFLLGDGRAVGQRHRPRRAGEAGVPARFPGHGGFSL